VDTSYQVDAPQFGVGNYVMLPGMSYTWRIRTATATVGLGENDPGWSPWNSRRFRTAAPSSTTVTAVGPAAGSTVASRNPTLQWQNSNGRIFYYEVMLSKDSTFNTDPATATASVYFELRHGGVTTPANSYTVPQAAPLEPGITYFWRVRPRVQGDGTPIPWSEVWSFRTGP
jgi:hypothetical protein